MENFKIESRYLKRVQGSYCMYEGCFLQIRLSKTLNVSVADAVPISHGIKRARNWELKLLFRGDLKLKKNELSLEGFSNCCSSLTGRFPKSAAFIIISVVVMKAFYYNPLWNLKEYKRFHQRDKTVTTYMYKELITLNG